MPSFELHTVMIHGFPDETDEACEFTQAYNKAKELFDEDLVPPLTSIGHNHTQSFCVYPSFSGQGREGQLKHKDNMGVFLNFLSETKLDWFCVHWKEYFGEGPHVYGSSYDF